MAGDTVHNRATGLGNLIIPSKFVIPEKQVLTMPWKNFRLNWSFFNDLLINFFGFIPFGFSFAALLWSINGFPSRHRLLITLTVGFGISLFFELCQVFIPTRSSQMSDLLLNTLGTLAGAFVAMKFFPDRRLKSDCN
jgi:glycopeptide antibiotics resistance protein